MEKVAELKVVRRRVEDLLEHPRNPREHPEEGSPEWNALRDSLNHDYFDPLVENQRNGQLVSGHLRRKGLLSMGVEEVDVVSVDYDEPTHVARMLAANRQFGSWVDEAVEELSQELMDGGQPAFLAGLGGDWEDDVDLEPEEVEESEVSLTRAEELQAKWEVSLGDMFVSEGVRLLCGDCCDAGNWKRLLDGELVDLVWTDPPYNVAYGSLQEHLKSAAGSSKRVDHIKNDALEEKEYEDLLLRALKTAAEVTREGGSIYIAHADSNRVVNQEAAVRAGWLIKQTLIWVKSSFTLGRQDYQWQHEPILYGWKEGAGHYWNGGHSQSTVIDEMELESLERSELLQLARKLLSDQLSTVIREAKPTGSSEIGHPTVKPASLVARQIWSSCPPGGLVLDLFGGSGSTLLASHQVGRRSVATELEPKFCAVILERFSQLGIEFERHGSG